MNNLTWAQLHLWQVFFLLPAFFVLKTSSSVWLAVDSPLKNLCSKQDEFYGSVFFQQSAEIICKAMHILVFNRMVARSENVRCKNKLIHTPRSQEGNYTADKNIICKWELFAARSKLFAFHPVAATLAKASGVFVTVVFFVQLQLFIFFVVTVRIALFHQTSLFISHPCLHCSSVPPLSFHTDTHIEC